jgi:hypothetical protein
MKERGGTANKAHLITSCCCSSLGKDAFLKKDKTEKAPSLNNGAPQEQKALL